MKKTFYLLVMLFLSTSIFAEDTPSQARQQNIWQTLIMIGVALLFFYLILWRPEQKRRKKMDTQRKSLSKGDRVTAMGIIGTVVRLEENSVILKMIDGAKIEVLKNAITDVQPKTMATSSTSQSNTTKSNNECVEK